MPQPILQRLERLALQWQPSRPPEPLAPPAPTPTSIGPGSHIPRLDRRSWRVLLTVAGLAMALAGWMWWQGRAQAIAPIPDRLAASPAASPMAPGGDAALVVHVIGAVRHPGLVHVPMGSRVADALQMAGGATSSKAEASVNLARPVVDGEQIVVNASGAQAGASTGGRVSLNSASVQEFEALPGVGPVLAQRIVDFRSEHGPFPSIDRLDDVSGIGATLMGQLRTHVQL